MSQTSVSEAPIMAKPVAVLESNFNKGTKVTPQYHHRNESHKHSEKTRSIEHQLHLDREKTSERKQDIDRTKTFVGALSTSTLSDSSEHTSSLLWTPNKRSNTRRSHRKKHSSQRLHKGELESMTEETTPFLPTQDQQTRRLNSKDLCSFERDYRENWDIDRRSSSRRSEKNSSRRSSHKHKRHQELYNDYTKYQYHRRSHKSKRNKASKHRRDDETGHSFSSKKGLPKIIQRIKQFFLGKKSDGEKYHITKRLDERPGLHLQEYSKTESHRQKHFEKYRQPEKWQQSRKLFRSASDSDIEAVKHHHRRKHRNKSRTKDDLCKDGKHWKTRRYHDENRLSSIYESSDKLGGLERDLGSDRRLVLAKKGTMTYNDIMWNSEHKHAGHRRQHSHRRSGHYKKEDRDTSEASHSGSSKSKGRHGRRSKDYRSLKKKWAKEHQSFENDLEKLEKLVELINLKKAQGFLDQQTSENTTLLERLEAKQEKCVAEVDFTRHVLICKLQRLENKLERSLSTIDNNNNNTEERERGIEEIREEMSKECRDLRKLLQETSDQLKHVLEEKATVTQSENEHIEDMTHVDSGRVKDLQQKPGETRSLENVAITSDRERHGEHASPRQENLSKRKVLNGGIKARSETALDTTIIPFPELTHHPLNKRYPRHKTPSSGSKEIKDKDYTRVSTYV